jgi:hypothetical protein
MRLNQRELDIIRTNLDRCPETRDKVPVSTLYNIREYVLSGVSQGDFMRAVLTNNLRESIAHADLDNRRHLANIVVYLTNYAPATCWGDEDTYRTWVKNRGAIGSPDRPAGNPLGEHVPTEQALRSGETAEVGEYHVWYANGKFRVSVDWSVDETEPGDKSFATYDQLVAWLTI